MGSAVLSAARPTPRLLSILRGVAVDGLASSISIYSLRLRDDIVSFVARVGADRVPVYTVGVDYLVEKDGVVYVVGGPGLEAPVAVTTSDRRTVELVDRLYAVLDGLHVIVVRRHTVVSSAPAPHAYMDVGGCLGGRVYLAGFAPGPGADVYAPLAARLICRRLLASAALHPTTGIPEAYRIRVDTGYRREGHACCSA